VERFGNLRDLRVEQNSGAIVITINRPKFLNALNKEVLEELSNVTDIIVEGFPGIPVIITGEGSRAFVAGADIGQMAEMSPDEAREFSRFGQGVFSKLEGIPTVTIAAVNGYALGGGNELALACNIRIASRNAKFGQPEVGLGIIPGFGGTQRLPRIVGKSNALDLICTGRVIDAQEAFRIGLVHKVVDEGKALEEALSYAALLQKNSPFALCRAKEAIAGFGSPDPGEGMEAEAELFNRCFDYPDQKEGMKAFMEKRRPVFKQIPQ
jgi:enoyl-CoA hydratase